MFVCSHILKLVKTLQFFHQPPGPQLQLVRVGVFQAVLKLRPRNAIFHRQILHGLHVERDAFHLGQFRRKPPNNVRSADASLLQRLQVDLHAARIYGGVRAVDPNKGRETLHAGVSQNHARKRLLPVRHGRKRYGLPRFRNTQDHAGILHREKPLGNHDIQPQRRHQRPHCHKQRQRLVAHHPAQRRRVTRDHPLEEGFRRPVQTVLLGDRLMPQQ